MKEKYYSFEEIKTKFKSYRELQESAITDDEYVRFCDEIQVLPREVVDKVQAEIQFVLLSGNPKMVNTACYINLRKGIEPEKIAIIVLTPFIFGVPYKNENGKEIRLDSYENPCILHEVAHHIFGHHTYKSQEDFDQKEKAAKEQAEKWVNQWIEYRTNEEDEL
jgi:hypothetical protein